MHCSLQSAQNMKKTDNNRVKMVKRLIKAGADVNAKNKQGQTALFFASDYRYLDMLLKAGADVNITDNDGNTTLHLLENLNNDDEGDVDYLKNYVMKCQNAKKILRDRLKNYHQCVKKLLRAGIHINRFARVQRKRKTALQTLLDYKDKNQTADPMTEIDYTDSIKFLYTAGETLRGTDVDKMPEELKFEEEKLELKHICREAIRKHLLKLDPHQRLFSRIPRLGLPSVVTEYLLFNQSLDDDEEDEEEEEEDDDDNDDDINDDGDDGKNTQFVLADGLENHVV